MIIAGIIRYLMEDYFTTNDIERGNKVVLIGSAYKKDIYKENGEKYIDIEKEKYKVLGIVGNDNEVSIWSSRIFMPFTALPDNIKKNMNNNLNITFILHNKNKNFESDIKKIKENSTKILGKASINYEGEIQTENVVENLVISPDKIYIIALVGYIVSMIYAVNIVIFWIEKRKYEIGS